MMEDDEEYYDDEEEQIGLTLWLLLLLQPLKCPFCGSRDTESNGEDLDGYEIRYCNDCQDEYIP